MLLFRVLGLHRHQGHVEGGNGRWQNDAALIAVQFHRRGQDALHADAVGPHDDGHRLAVSIQDRGPQGLGVLGAQLEDVADLNGAEHLQRAVTARAALTGGGGAQFGPGRLEVGAGGHAGEVVIVLVGAAGHVGAALQAFVRHHHQLRRRVHRAEAAGAGAHDLANLLVLGRPHLGDAGGGGQLGLVEFVVAPHQGHHRLFPGHVDQRLDLPLGGPVQEGLDLGDGLLPRRVDLLRRITCALGVADRLQPRGGLLQVGGVVAAGTGGDVVLAGVAAHHELLAGGAAHGA